MSSATLDYLLRLAIEDRDKLAKVMISMNMPLPAWGEAAAAVKELLEMKVGRA